MIGIYPPDSNTENYVRSFPYRTALPALGEKKPKSTPSRSELTFGN